MHTFVGTFIEDNYHQKTCFLLFSKITWFQKVMYKLYNSFVLKGHFCVTLKCLNQNEIMSGVDFFKNINKDLIVSYISANYYKCRALVLVDIVEKART